MAKSTKKAVQGKLEPIAIPEGTKKAELPGKIVYVPLDKVMPNPWQPRDVEADTDPALIELMESIEKHGLLAIARGRGTEKGGILQTENGPVELADGHRRFHAFKLLADKYKGSLLNERFVKLPVFVCAMGDQEMADAAFETQKSRPLSAIEQARGFKRYIETFKITQEDMARRMGFKDQSVISNALRLLELPVVVQDMIISHEITPTVGRELLRAKGNDDVIISVAKEASIQGTTSRVVGETVKRRLEDKLRPLSGQDWRYKLNFTPGKECLEKCDKVQFLDGDGDKAKPWCGDVGCWEKHNQAGLDKVKEKVAKNIASGKAVDLSKLSLKDYTQRSSADVLADPQECEGCEKNGTGTYGSNEVRVCFNPKCYQKKKTAATRGTNEIIADHKDDLVEYARATVEQNHPFNMTVSKAILREIVDYQCAGLVAVSALGKKKGDSAATLEQAYWEHIEKIDRLPEMWLEIMRGMIVKLTERGRAVPVRMAMVDVLVASISGDVPMPEFKCEKCGKAPDGVGRHGECPLCGAFGSVVVTTLPMAVKVKTEKKGKTIKAVKEAKPSTKRKGKGTVSAPAQQPESKPAARKVKAVTADTSPAKPRDRQTILAELPDAAPCGGCSLIEKCQPTMTSHSFRIESKQKEVKGKKKGSAILSGVCDQLEPLKTDVVAEAEKVAKNAVPQSQVAKPAPKSAGADAKELSDADFKARLMKDRSKDVPCHDCVPEKVRKCLCTVLKLDGDMKMICEEIQRA